MTPQIQKNCTTILSCSQLSTSSRPFYLEKTGQLLSAKFKTIYGHTENKAFHVCNTTKYLLVIFPILNGCVFMSMKRKTTQKLIEKYSLQQDPLQLYERARIRDFDRYESASNTQHYAIFYFWEYLQIFSPN